MNGITCTSIGVKRSECHDEIGTFLDVWKVLKVRKNYIGYEVGHDRLANVKDKSDNEFESEIESYQEQGPASAT